MGKSITESQWADWEKTWREWFPKEELPLGGKCKYWALPYTHKFQLPFMIHDVLCVNETETLDGRPMIEVDWMLEKTLDNLSSYTIIWPTRNEDGSINQGRITETEPLDEFWYRGQAEVFMNLVMLYR